MQFLQDYDVLIQDLLDAVGFLILSIFLASNPMHLKLEMFYLMILSALIYHLIIVRLFNREKHHRKAMPMYSSIKHTRVTDKD